MAGQGGIASSNGKGQIVVECSTLHQLGESLLKNGCNR
jgi:hypothetical protein